MIASIRHQVRIARPAAEVWALAGDPARIHEWFPGIVGCKVEGDRRTITTGAGFDLPEQIVVDDDLQRRFQYRLDLPNLTHHRGTLDVIDLDDGTCLVVYATDADPRTMALMVAGGCREALDELKRQMEGTG